VSAPSSAATVSRAWPRVALLGLGYFVIGIATAALSRHAGSSQMKQAWRLAAWALSAVLFAAQILYERIRLGGAAASTALRAALAVAVGGFLLAVAASVHALAGGRARVGPQLVALVAWPVLLAVPAFLIAWAVAYGLSRMSDSGRRNSA